MSAVARLAAARAAAPTSAVARRDALGSRPRAATAVSASASTSPRVSSAREVFPSSSRHARCAFARGSDDRLARAAAPSRRRAFRSRAAHIARAEAASGEPQRYVPTGKSAWVLALSLAVAAAAFYLTTQYTQVGQAAYGALSKSGFTAAFALIFVSELGDKTFFIAALLAMRLGRFTVLAGATTALSLMSVISVVIGRIFQKIPSTLNDSVPIGEYLAVALLLFFGVRTLREALETPEATDDAESGEFADAAEAVTKSEANATKGGRGQNFITKFWETFSLVFIAEWGDRSMLATIALGAAQNPVGVATGASCGHLVATLIAVVGGALLGKRISERQVGIWGGVLFIGFAIATLAGVF